MQHQGLFIRDYLQSHSYLLDEVVELTGISEEQLNEYLEMPVVLGDVVAKIAFHIAAKKPEDFFKLPGDGQPFGQPESNALSHLWQCVGTYLVSFGPYEKCSASMLERLRR